MTPSNDRRIVMTLDAGGTNFKFSAIRGNKPATEAFIGEVRDGSWPDDAHSFH